MPRRIYVLATLTLLAVSPSIADDKPKGPERWEPAIKKFEEEDARVRRKSGATLFIGSSSIRMWDLGESFPDKNYINRGFGGSEISDSIHFADRIVFPYQPKAIVLYAGDNDIAKGKSADHVVKDFQTFVKIVHQKLPQTKIVFIAIKPSIKRWSLIETIRDANKRIAAICDNDALLAFADIDTPMIGNNGEPKPELFAKDGLHLNETGYQVWKKVVTKHLDD